MVSVHIVDLRFELIDVLIHLVDFLFVLPFFNLVDIDVSPDFIVLVFE